MTNTQFSLEDRLLAELRVHLKGLREKIVSEFSQENFKSELSSLDGDAVYRDFAFNNPTYVLIRLMGRISISIGRRLGELYDKLPRLAAQNRYGLTAKQVAPMMGKLALDLAIRWEDLKGEDRDYVASVLRKHLPGRPAKAGLGIEVRYNFNPNDSARIRKDVEMARMVKAEGLLPIYLVFSGLSPRDDAISRLTRAGWHFLVGKSASDFADDLFGFDLAGILQKDKTKQSIHEEVSSIMSALTSSHAFRAVVSAVRDEPTE